MIANLSKITLVGATPKEITVPQCQKWGFWLDDDTAALDIEFHNDGEIVSAYAPVVYESPISTFPDKIERSTIEVTASKNCNLNLETWI